MATFNTNACSDGLMYDKNDSQKNEIISSRTLSYPVELVFEAFENPDHLQIWWGPEGFTNTFLEFDFRENGKWNFVMHGPNGTDYVNECTFLEIEKPSRIYYAHHSQPLFKKEMTFEAQGQNTLLTWRMSFESEAIRNSIAKLAGDGNEQNFDRLEDELGKMI